MIHICEMRLRNPATAEYEVVETQRMQRVPEEGSVVEIFGRQTRVGNGTLQSPQRKHRCFRSFPRSVDR